MLFASRNRESEAEIRSKAATVFRSNQNAKTVSANIRVQYKRSVTQSHVGGVNCCRISSSNVGVVIVTTAQGNGFLVKSFPSLAIPLACNERQKVKSWKRLVPLLVFVLAIALAPLAHATDPDPADLISEATTNLGLIKTVVFSAVGFFLAIRFVKWIRK